MAHQRVNESLPVATDLASREMIASAGKSLAAPFEWLRSPAEWLVVLVFAATLVLWILGLTARFDPPYLILALNFVFIGIGSVLIAALGTRAFLRSGSWPVLWLGAGALTFGLGTVASGWVLVSAQINVGVTIHNSSALLAAAFHALGAFFVVNGVAPQGRPTGRRAAVLQVYAGLFAVILLVIVAAARGFLPAYFVPGAGGTHFRQTVVTLASLLFFGAGLVFLFEYRRGKAAFLYWYALGLLLTALGMAGVLVQKALGTPTNWMGRTAQLLGGLYLLAAALLTVSEARARNLRPEDVLAGFFWRNEANLRLLFRSIMDAIIVTDQRFVITDWNHAAEEVYGWQAEEVIGKPLFAVVPTAFLVAEDQARSEATVRNGGTWRGELRQRRRDGSEIEVLATASAVRDAAGSMVGAVAVNRDITERKQMEDEIRRARTELEQRVQERTSELLAANRHLARQATVLEQINEAVLVMDAEYRLSVMNRTAEELYGWKAEEVIGKPANQVFTSEFVGQTREEAFRQLYEQGHWSGEVIICGKNGARIHCDSRGVILHDEDGRTIGIVSVNRDITDRKRSEEALQESQRQLQALSRRLVESVEKERRAIARELHDVSGQNLTAVLIGLGVLQRRKDCSEDMRARLEELKRQVDETMQELHQMTFDLRPISLDRLGLPSALQQLVHDFERRYEVQTDMAVVGLHEAGRLPSEVETVSYRIVQEALTNIARHAHARNVSVLIQGSDGRVKVMVEDDGCGFDLEEAQSRGRLGILGMRERAEMVGGTLEVDSTVGSGTTVLVDLPLPVTDTAGKPTGEQGGE